jgi:putative transposase
MRCIDEEYTRHPFYGVKRMTGWLLRQGYAVNEKRVRRLLRLMGIMAIYPKPHLSAGSPRPVTYPYLLRELTITRPDQVWATDITYIRMRKGFIYLVAIMDLFSRYVLSWEVSTTLETEFCLWALDRALLRAKPEIFNSDQGVQFTSDDFTGRLKHAEIRISWDGKGRAYDNIFVERLWRSVKYEEVYLKDYATVREAVRELNAYFRFYNTERLHQSLEYRTPWNVYRGITGADSRGYGLERMVIGGE